MGGKWRHHLPESDMVHGRTWCKYALMSREPRLCKDDWIIIKKYLHIYDTEYNDRHTSMDLHTYIHTYIQKRMYLRMYLRISERSTEYEPCRAKRRSSCRGSSFCMFAIASPSHSQFFSPSGGSNSLAAAFLLVF